MSTTLWHRLESADPEERRLAAHALANDSSDDAAALLERALADESWRVRKKLPCPRRASRGAPTCSACCSARSATART